ncbi:MULTISPECIES: hypothetical protein [Variovorax]|uniref:hypothetical protein n=1 Tax=Variovorax TaxID=34072 RepID=UPI00040C1F17|nr:hypothetical protein [Variovorax paradoxus]MBW8719944.1 hypothetical protein [Variovorax paradoxus]MBW8891363.1 hypothetical protein [Burkholderiales bacterium]
MNTLRTLGSIALVFLAGCTALTSADDQKDKDHLRHHPPAATAPAAMKSEQQMAQMREMHRKMMAARTPQERQALMAEHMKAMQGGMSMMCEMGAAPAPQSGAPSDDMMKRCMAMKDMTMQMMQDRERLQPPAR